MSTEKSIINKSVFHFRSQEVTSKTGESLLKLVADGKLAADQLTPETVDGKDWVKRTSVTVDLAVPNVAGLVIEGALTPEQLAHMQAALVQYLEGKQKIEVDGCTGKVIDWLELFSSPFASKVAAIKVTADMLKAAKAIILEALDGKVDGTAYAKPAGLKIVENLFDSRASLASCLQYAPNVLERIKAIITTGTEVLVVADKLGVHADAIDLILTNIDKALAPKTSDLSADDI